MDSLSSIICWTADFSRAAIYISEKFTKNPDKTNYRTQIAKLIKGTGMKEEMNGILKPFNLKVDRIEVDPEGLLFYQSKKFFIEHLTDTTNISVPDSILYVPLVISINNMNK